MDSSSAAMQRALGSALVELRKAESAATRLAVGEADAIRSVREALERIIDHLHAA